MPSSKDSPVSVIRHGGTPSEFALAGLRSLQTAVDKAVDRKTRLGQYWVEWDGEKPVKIYPENPTDTAAE